MRNVKCQYLYFFPINATWAEEERKRKRGINENECRCLKWSNKDFSFLFLSAGSICNWTIRSLTVHHVLKGAILHRKLFSSVYSTLSILLVCYVCREASLPPRWNCLPFSRLTTSGTLSGFLRWTRITGWRILQAHMY